MTYSDDSRSLVRDAQAVASAGLRERPHAAHDMLAQAVEVLAQAGWLRRPPQSVDDGVAVCVVCGCTEDAACEGGCWWVPNPHGVDLCSACSPVPGERAELARLRAQVRRVLQLAAGRPGYHQVGVKALLRTVAEPDRPTRDDAPAVEAPLAVTWTGPVTGSGDDPGRTAVDCQTDHGYPVTLTLDGIARQELARLLAAPSPTACGTGGCGLDEDELDISDPTVWGWICVHIHGTDGPARWWCSPPCAAAAITRAGAELAAADAAALIEEATHGE
ncbi:hypothetical protein [Streptomyces sp. WMMC897]|uniref:hypothetical protein n=1 Tax=Streptomyces sp. WMMC897 TaxID=3014782 RepID=UPI0022B6897D|nr:hypothetical protein [Streptomyces sp. WMMC897]MCZ7414276.1 hypothetical protein [Streptomyces sp. WMMC897]